MTELSEEELKTIETIKSMTQYQMAHLSRFAPTGHPYFDVTKPFNKVFKEEYAKKGGMTSTISKAIGWG